MHNTRPMFHLRHIDFGYQKNKKNKGKSNLIPYELIYKQLYVQLSPLLWNKNKFNKSYEELPV